MRPPRASDRKAFPLQEQWRRNIYRGSREAGIAQLTQCYGMTVVAADLDEDGWPDIYVACDSTPSLLFINNHDGTFREEGVLRGVALSEDGKNKREWAWGLVTTISTGIWIFSRRTSRMTLAFFTTMTARGISTMLRGRSHRCRNALRVLGCGNH